MTHSHSPRARAEEVLLPNGSFLRRGGRVRVPSALIWHPDVSAHAARLGWELEHDSASPESEVLCWPDSPDEEPKP